ncbi:MAG TPA: protein tyrosine phosphatase family protein [Mucilaginibacter sp.]
MSSIYNFHQISDRLACAGQPREGQLAAIADEDYQVVINLGLLDGKYALADEALSVKNLGLTYHHIPVVFDNPQMDELTTFIGLMNDHTDEKTLVHCAANYRASVFTGLYLFATDQLDEQEMQGLIEEVWQPDGTWQQFIEESIAYIKSSD